MYFSCKTIFHIHTFKNNFDLAVLNVYSHWAINDDFERIAPSLVFLLLLTCRLVVDWQIVRSERNEKEKLEEAQAKAAAAGTTAASVDEEDKKEK